MASTHPLPQAMQTASQATHASHRRVKSDWVSETQQPLAAESSTRISLMRARPQTGGSEVDRVNGTLIRNRQSQREQKSGKPESDSQGPKTNT
eukprot:6747045-Heterocapsa_arctica.AAC.1